MDDVQKFVVEDVVKHELGHAWVVEDLADDDGLVVGVPVAKALPTHLLAPRQLGDRGQDEAHVEADAQV